ncbi:hypothetical protein [Nocardia sp. NPDC058705]|uniref:hypothetical protein n=1 Tax=Nocardia sp. NPDC058705 TaxID=3346609 RepID=UPI0036BD18D3
MIVPVGCGVGSAGDAGFVVTDPPDDAVVDGAGTIVGWSAPEAGVMTVVVTLGGTVEVMRGVLVPDVDGSASPHPTRAIAAQADTTSHAFLDTVTMHPLVSRTMQ